MVRLQARRTSRLLALGTAAVLVTGCGALSPAEAPAGSDTTAPPADSASGTVPPTGAAAGADSGPGTPADFSDEAAEIVAGYSDEELTGAVVMATYPGTDGTVAAQLAADLHLAGVIVMGDNLPEGAGPEEVREVTAAITDSEEESLPLLVGVDEEGGPVARLDGAGPDVPPLMAHGAADDPALTEAVTEAQAHELRSLGFTLDFAPVADVTVGAADPAINVRSAGSDPERVADIVSAASTGYSTGGILSSAKHFPGHGALTTDSHEGLPVSEESIEEMADRDRVPFEAAVEAGTPTVMMGHIGLPGAEEVPATLNPEAYEALRDTLDYDGLVVTDALNMGAITPETPGDETVDAIAAGADLALMPPDTEAAVSALGAALESGELPRDRLVEAAERVVAARLWQEAAVGGDDAADAAGDEAEGTDVDDATQDLADASLTVLAGECTFADAGSEGEGTSEVTVASASEEVLAVFTDAAADAGLTITDDAEVSVALDATNTGADVVIGTDAPWDLAEAAANAGDGDTVLALYDDYAAGLRAAAEYLAGDLEASGELPVEFDGVEPPDCD